MAYVIDKAINLSIFISFLDDLHSVIKGSNETKYKKILISIDNAWVH